MRGVIIHVLPERQVTVWLADFNGYYTEEEPRSLCFLYSNDSTVIVNYLQVFFSLSLVLD